MEIGLYFGGQPSKRCAHVFGDGRRRRPGCAKPETADMRGRVLASHYIAELFDTIEAAGLGIEQRHEAREVIGEIGARQVPGVVVPIPVRPIRLPARGPA